MTRPRAPGDISAHTRRKHPLFYFISNLLILSLHKQYMNAYSNTSNVIVKANALHQTTLSCLGYSFQTFSIHFDYTQLGTEEVHATVTVCVNMCSMSFKINGVINSTFCPSIFLKNLKKEYCIFEIFSY